MTSKQFPISKPYLTELEKEYVNKALDSTWISSKGEFLKRFEDEFAKYCRRSYATAIANGTLAIELALDVLELPKRSEIIVPSLTFIASVNPIVRAGHIPVFVDVDPESWTMDPKEIDKAISSKTKAIIVVPLYGHAVDYDPILALAKKYDLRVIEDAAEAHGALYKGKMCGSFGDISCFSFYGNKILTTGEGGMCLTDDKELHIKQVMKKNHGMYETGGYLHPVLGFNCRMTNLQAAIGVAQMEKLDVMLKERKQILIWYEQELGDLKEKKLISFQPRKSWADLNVWFVSILLDNRFNRDDVMSLLKSKGVETRPLFHPVHKQPIYKEYHHITLPYTEDIAKRGLSLPTYIGLTQDDIKYIVQVLKEVLASFK